MEPAGGAAKLVDASAACPKEDGAAWYVSVGCMNVGGVGGSVGAVKVPVAYSFSDFGGSPLCAVMPGDGVMGGQAQGSGKTVYVWAVVTYWHG